MPVLEVTIRRKDGQLVPSVNPIALSKSKGQQIKWVNGTDEEITISFVNSPFPATLNPYIIPAGKHADSGPIEATADTNWNYSINGAAIAAAATVDSIQAKAAADLPEIDIKP